MNPALRTESGDMQWEPQDRGLQSVGSGIEQGLHNVITKLVEVDSHVLDMPNRIASALSGQGGFLREGNGAGIYATATASNGSHVAGAATSRIEELERANIQLEASLSNATQEIEERMATENKLRSELRDLEREMARLQKKEAYFREIILGSAGTQKITDHEIIQAFSDLRQEAQQLASSPVFDLKNIHKIAPDPRKQKTRQFYAVCRDLRSRDVSNRLKAHIFTVLYQRILVRQVFGLKREDRGNEEKEHLWQMEEYLAHFEQYLMMDDKVNDGVIADWRLRTLDCVEMLKLPERYSHFVASELRPLLEPLVSKRVNAIQVDEMWRKTVDVCQKAVQLKMLMQRSKEGYNVMPLDIKEFPTYPEMEHLADSMDVEGGRSADASDEVAYVLFGALTKYTKYLGGPRTTLVKGEVILKKKRDSDSYRR